MMKNIRIISYQHLKKESKTPKFIYNELHSKLIEVLEGESICNECNGMGLHHDPQTYIGICMKCKGAGKLDWIQKAMGG